jgi:phosphate transport system substrate-binding protein
MQGGERGDVYRDPAGLQLKRTNEKEGNEQDLDKEAYMRLSIKLMCVTLSLSVCIALISLVGAEPKKMIFAGAGTNLAITRILADAFMKKHPNIAIQIPESIGSAGGIKAVSEGAIAVGLSSRPFNEDEKKLGLELEPYARTIIIIGAHPDVPDDNITYEEFVQIYRGEKTKWKNGHDIIVLTRNENESTIDVMKQKIPGFREAFVESLKARRWIIAFTDQDMNKMLTTTPDSIGITDYGTITAEHLAIKMLKVNGYAPTPENTLKGRYALFKTLYFVFRSDEIQAEAKSFRDFIRSKEGRTILKANGYLLVEEK